MISEREALELEMAASNAWLHARAAMEGHNEGDPIQIFKNALLTMYITGITRAATDMATAVASLERYSMETNYDGGQTMEVSADGLYLDRDLVMALFATLVFVYEPGTRYRHKKRGSEYRIINTAKMQIEGDLDMAEMVIYQGDDGALWVRPKTEFEDGRFELIG